MRSMDHVAIMSKRFGDLIPKILSGEKKIESRWSKHKIAPWDRVKCGDTVYFKNAGTLVTAVAEVDQVLQFENLNPGKVEDILDEYGGQDGINVTSYERTLEWARGKRYCVLMWLKNPRKIKPFRINKSGFGSAAAWLHVRNISAVKAY